MIRFPFATVLILAAVSFTSLHASNVVESPGSPAPGAASQFQISEKTQVPGHTLKPGNYTITVVDRLSDRMVLRITSPNGKEESTFLAVPATAAFPAQSSSGPINMRTTSNHGAALRGFVFADGTRAEFVYIKAEAVPLAKANDTTLVAIDPASEGRPDKSNLSPTDRKLVSLWMLTPTVVGNTPGMQAQRYQEASSSTPATASATQDHSQPSQPAPPTVVARNSPSPAPPTPTAPHRVAKPVAVLPHTASSQPLILLIGMLSLPAAVLVGRRRRLGVITR